MHKDPNRLNILSSTQNCFDAFRWVATNINTQDFYIPPSFNLSRTKILFRGLIEVVLTRFDALRYVLKGTAILILKVWKRYIIRWHFVLKVKLQFFAVRVNLKLAINKLLQKLPGVNFTRMSRLYVAFKCAFNYAKLRKFSLSTRSS